jgi:hypothetical protein
MRVFYRDEIAKNANESSKEYLYLPWLLGLLDNKSIVVMPKEPR